MAGAAVLGLVLLVSLARGLCSIASKDVIGKTAQLEFNLLRQPAQLERAVKVIDKVVKGEEVTDTAEVDSAALEEKEIEDE